MGKIKLNQMDYNICVNHVNVLQTNIIKIIIKQIMLIKFIILMILKYILNVNKLIQLQTLVKI